MSPVANSLNVDDFRLCALVTVLVRLLTYRSGMAVGQARKRLGVPMPKTKGPAEFERIFRAHCNNSEQYPQFLALMWTFAAFCNATVAGLLGIVWVLARFGYVAEYHKSADKIHHYTVPAYLVLSCYCGGILFVVLKSYVTEYLL